MPTNRSRLSRRDVVMAALGTAVAHTCIRRSTKWYQYQSQMQPGETLWHA